MEPTHELAVDPGAHDGDDVREWTNAALFAVTEAAQRVELTGNMSWIDEDLPTLAAALRDATTAVGTDDGDSVLVGPMEDVREPLADLLDRSSAHRYLALERVVLSDDDAPIASLHPESDTFELHADHAPELEASVRAALEGTQARLVDASVRAEFEVDSGTLQLDSPYLQYSRGTAFHLTALESVTVDGASRTLHFEWRDEDSTASDGLLDRARSKLGTKQQRPRELVVEDEAALQTAVETFRDLAAEFGFEVVTQSRD